jgi:Chaperone of endosialidase
MEVVMRKSTSLAAVAALFAAAMLLSAPSQAMTPGTASSVRGAAATIDPVEKTACWRYGWRGWGWYPCYYGYYGGYSPYRYGYYGYGYRPFGYYGGYGYRRWGWSDVNLKHDIVPVGHLANGLGLYRFSYNDSDKVYVGVLAQEVERVMPDAVRRAPNGYLQVNYARIGVPMMTWDQWVEAGRRH